MVPTTVVIKNQLPAVWVDALELEFMLADILELEYWAAFLMMYCVQFAIYDIF